VSPRRRRSVFSDPLEPRVEEKHQRPSKQANNENGHKKAVRAHLCAPVTNANSDKSAYQVPRFLDLTQGTAHRAAPAGWKLTMRCCDGRERGYRLTAEGSFLTLSEIMAVSCVMRALSSAYSAIIVVGAVGPHGAWPGPTARRLAVNIPKRPHAFYFTAMTIAQ
jgi:hypothetical protein